MDSSNLNPPAVVQADRVTLQQLVIKLLQRKGMFAAEAEIVAERMIEADLQQRSGEGVGSLPEYLEAMDLGDIDPRARMITVSETPAIAVLDGSTGIGHVATSKAMLIAVEKAGAVGTGSVVVKNSRPCGDLGGVARLAAMQGMIGLVTTSFDDGAESLGWAWAVPAPPGAAPYVQRERSSNLAGAFSILCILSAGLAGADPLPRKRKAARAANVVEYNLTAISPDKFGSWDAFSSKWKSLWHTTVNVEDQTASTTVPLQPTDAQRLAELAAKVKFPVSW